MALEEWSKKGYISRREGGPGAEQPWGGGGSEAEGPEGVEEAVRVLKVHVVAGGARLAVAALQEQDLLGDARGDGGGEAALAGRDAGEAGDVGTAGTQDAPERVCEHLGGEGVQGRDRPASGAVLESGEEGRAVRAASSRVRLLLAEG